MSFFDDASLAFLPSGGAGKDTKAYSIKPTDGSGDFTFSRGSNLSATRVGPTGLIEKGRENVLLQSNQFDTTWGLEATTLTSGQTGYDGSSDAWKVIPITDNSTHYVYKTTPYQTGVSTFSVYAKYSGYHAQLRVFNIGGGKAYANFDLQNGTKGTSGGTDIIDSTITSVGNGWYRITLSLNYTIAPYSSGVIPIESPTDGEIPSYAGDGTSGVLIQDFQHEVGLAATDYIESGATTGKAGLLEDEPRFDYSGGATCPSLLLEPSRTNLFTQSEYFNSSDWTKNNVTATNNSAISPDGLQNATLINDGTASNTQHWFYQSVTLSSGTTYTISFYAKYVDRKNMCINIYDGATSNFVYYDIQNGVVLNADGNAVRDIVDVGSGWYRITYTRTIVGSGANFRIAMANNAPNISYTGENKEALIYGLQVEAGSYPTSYIPNHSGGSVTRGVDDLSLTSASSLIGQTEGTFFVDWEIIDQIGDRYIGLTSSNNRILFYRTISAVRVQIRANNSNEYVSANLNNIDGRNKLAISYTSGDIKVYLNGSEAETSTATFTFSNPLDTFDFQVESKDNKTRIYQCLTIPEALSGADLATLTTL